MLPAEVVADKPNSQTCQRWYEPGKAHASKWQGATPAGNHLSKVTGTDDCWKGNYHIAKCWNNGEQYDEEVDNPIPVEEWRADR